MSHAKCLLHVFLLNMIYVIGTYASMRTLIWDDDSCQYKLDAIPEQSYEIIYNGEKVYGICDTIPFRGYDKSFEYEVCVEVKEFNVACDVTLQYRAGTSFSTYSPDKSYSCANNGDDIPIFCSPFEKLLYITIESNQDTSSRIVLNVKNGKSEGGISDRVWFYLRLAGGIVAFLILIGLTVYGIKKCIAKRRFQRDRQQRINKVEREVYGPKDGTIPLSSNVDQSVTYSKVLSETEGNS